MRTERVVYKGTPYRRYPDSASYSDRRYFRASYNTEHGTRYLHRSVWEDANGEIPPGYHVHHKDGDPANNVIGNLELREGRNHRPETVLNRPSDLVHLANIRPLSVEWHRSEQGRKWHVKHAREAYKKRVPRQAVCDQCGASFEDISRRVTDRFCSNKCKSAWRRAQGLDDIVIVCENCRKTFSRNKYDRVRFCSYRCAALSRFRA